MWLDVVGYCIVKRKHRLGGEKEKGRPTEKKERKLKDWGRVGGIVTGELKEEAVQNTE
jgi:hypothetical protein